MQQKGYRGTFEEPSTETSALIYASGIADIRGGTSVVGSGTFQAEQIVIRGQSIALGITDPNQAMAAPRLPDPVIDLTRYFNAPGSTGVDGRTGGFSGPSTHPVTINGITYLNAAPIPGDANERGPGWILEQVGDVRTNLAFFADPTTERRAIQQAILDQTGRAFLDPKYRNPAEQQEALWQGTVDFLKSHPDIKLGDTLTAAQRASLTEPILWYVAQNINGQTVLVPQLILPETRLAEWTKTNGGAVVADDIYLSGGTIYNSGAILATNTLSISADTFTNERRSATLMDGANGIRGTHHVEMIQDGGLLAGNVIQIVTTGNLTNIGGTIIADKALNLVAGGDLILTSTVVSNSASETSKKYSAESSSTQNYGGTIYSGGDATLFAGNNLTIAGSSVIALGNVSLMAGNDLSISSVTDVSHQSETNKSSNVWRTKTTSSSHDSTTEVASNIVAGGNLTVAAAGNVNIHASNLVSGNDMLVAAGAGANGKDNASVTITAGQNTTANSANQTKSGIGVGSGDGWANYRGRKSTSIETDTLENVASTLAAGGNLTITATQDIAIQGSIISAGGTAGLSAGRDITVTPGENSSNYDYKRTVSGFGIGERSYDSELKAQYGYHRERQEYTQDQTTIIPSVIQGGAGVVMNAGNDITLQAATIASPGNITLTAGHDINMTVAHDTYATTTKTDQFFTGVTAKATQNVTGIISSLQQVDDIFNSGHGGAGYQAVGVISGVMKAMDTISAAAGGPRGSASITAGGEGKKTSAYESVLTAHGTSLEAGGNLTITAGNDLHMIGVQGHSGGDMTLSAGHDLIIESAQSYAASGSKAQSWNAGAGVGASAGAGGYSAGFHVEGGFSRSENEATATEQVNSHLVADGKLSLHSGNDTTIAGAVLYGSDVKLDVGNNLTIQSRQDLGHTEGDSVRAGGSVTIGYGFAMSVYAGGGTSESDVAWVREQTGIYSGGKLDVRVENHTQIDGAVIASRTDDLTLDTGTLGFTTIKDHDTGSSFDMTLSMSYSNQKDTPYSWVTAQNSGSGAGTGSAGGSSGSTGGGEKSGTLNQNNTILPPGPSISGSIAEPDRQQDTNATIGAGTIIIRNQDAQKQDVAAVNRDLSQAQVITKDESAGVSFYASSQAVNNIASPKAFTQDTLRGFERTFDQLAAMGNNTAAQLREAARNGTFNLDTVEDLKACTGQQGWNLQDLFVTKAYAAGTCQVRIGGVWKEFRVQDAEECYQTALKMMQEAGFSFLQETNQLGRTQDDGPGAGVRINDIQRYLGQQAILNGQQSPVMYGEDGTLPAPMQVQWNGTTQYLYSNPITGGPEYNNPYFPVQNVGNAPNVKEVTRNSIGTMGIVGDPDALQQAVGVQSPMLTSMGGYQLGVALDITGLASMAAPAVIRATATGTNALFSASAEGTMFIRTEAGIMFRAETSSATPFLVEGAAGAGNGATGQFISISTVGVLGVSGSSLGKGGFSGVYNYYMAEAGVIDVSTPTGGAVFYSGGGGANGAFAQTYASANGLYTIEMTPGGSWLNNARLFRACPINPN